MGKMMAKSDSRSDNSIKFRQLRRSARIHSPLTGFGVVEVPYEIRWDPLTIRWGPLTDRTTRILGGEEIDRLPPDDFSAYIEASAPCFFCGKSLFEKTPRYPEEVLPGGRQLRGESVLFPNLRAYAGYAAVIVLSDRPAGAVPPPRPRCPGQRPRLRPDRISPA
jgi:UDPglucose--hexose-1-phosphate uridylyltransferase